MTVIVKDSMIAELFLSCALALHPVYFKEPDSINEWINQYHELKEFVQRIHPGAEVMVTRVDNPPDDPHWFKLPFLWNEMAVWVKMHHIYDTRGSHGCIGEAA